MNISAAIDRIPVPIRIRAWWALLGLAGSLFVGLDIGFIGGYIPLSGPSRHPHISAPTHTPAYVASKFSTYMAAGQYQQACGLSTNPTGCTTALQNNLRGVSITNSHLVAHSSARNPYENFKFVGTLNGKQVSWIVTVSTGPNPQVTNIR